MFHSEFNYGLVLYCLQCKFRVIAELLLAFPSVLICLEGCVLENKVVFMGMILRISELMKSKTCCSFNRTE